MRHAARYASFAVLAVATFFGAAAAADNVVLPPGPVPAKKTEPVPVAPPPAPALTEGVLYVAKVNADKVLVLDRPPGLVKVDVIDGPVVHMSAKFWGGTGDYEDQTFEAKKVVRVRAVKGAKGTVFLDFVEPDLSVKSTSLLVLGGDPKVDPDAKTDPKTDPKVDPKTDPKVDPPAPIGGGVPKLLVVFEANTSARPEAQNAIIYGVPAREFMATKFGAGNVRIWPDGANTAGADKVWADAYANNPRTAKDWVIVSNGKTGYSGPLPATVDEFKTLVTKYVP